MIDWVEQAKIAGFDAAAAIDPHKLIAKEEVRNMCTSDRCGAYNKNWACPLACGTIQECQDRLEHYANGILVQSIGYMKKTIDSRCYRETEKRHTENFRVFASLIQTVYPDALCLGAGGCRICAQCAYPDACRHPEKAKYYSMEGYGLFVTQVCRDAGIPYYYGEKTITYSACILY